MRIVLDTTLLVSGIFYIGKPWELLEKILRGEIGIIVSDEILDEYEDVCLRDEFYEKGGIDKDLVKFVLGEIEKIAARVKPKKSFEASKDPKDNKFLNVAVEGKVDYVLSSDEKHLLILKSFQGIPIIRVSEFLDELKKKERLPDYIVFSSQKPERIFIIESKAPKMKPEEMKRRFLSYLLSFSKRKEGKDKQ